MEGKRDKVRQMEREQRPILLIGSPMCTQFSTWQSLNYSKSDNRAAMRRAHAGACAHMQFVSELYHELIAGNRCFLHEHPRHATSWQLKCMKELQSLPSVDTVRGDQCQYGAVTPHGPDQGLLERSRLDSCPIQSTYATPCLACARDAMANAHGPRVADTSHAKAA